MCGIAGIINFNEGDYEDKSIIENILKNINHRGPDFSDYVKINNNYLGMARLSIIDVKNGNQPIKSNCGNYIIIFNGEIYNYQILRNELIANGVIFKTLSDTEVLLNAFIFWGLDFFDKIEGMFACSIYNIKENKFLIFRDRLGKKPLYYLNINNKIIFSSEVSSLIKIDKYKYSIDQESYWNYLTFRYIPNHNTSVNEIKKVEPGTYIEISNQKLQFGSFWKFPKFKHNQFNIKKKDNVNKFGKLFSKAVKKRLISDVPIGVVLSGGLDSSAILFESSKKMKIDSYHVHFETKNKNFTELNYAKKIAKFTNSKLHTIEMSEQKFIDKLVKITDITDEPLSDLASIPFKDVCDLASQDVKVVLSGEGSDEVLAGYGLENVLVNLIRLKIANKSYLLSTFLHYLLKKIFKKNLLFLQQLGTNINNWPSKNRFNITNQISHLEKISLLKENSRYYQEDAGIVIDKIYEKYHDQDPINQILQVISRDWLTENVLMKSDKVSMSSSIELRCPFLDNNLIEFLFSLPSSSKINYINFKLQNKYLLKQYMKNKIPNEIIFRKKYGFPVPAYEFKDSKSKDFVFDVLNSSDNYYASVFQKNKIINLYENVIKKKIINKYYFIWSIVIYELWYKKFRYQING